MSETSADDLLLRVIDVRKAYGGVHALRGASLELRSGEVHALIGENGAGKSTLIRIITGALKADAGELLLEGRPIVADSPRAVKEMGIAAIYQQPALFPELTVAENMAIGIEAGPGWGRIDWRERRRRAAELLARVGADIDPGIEAGDLSMPQQQLVEIARALGADAKVLVLDEPTASLSADDTRNLFAVIRQLRERGVGLIYISHRLEELPAIADRVTVLRDGRTIDTRPVADVGREDLIRMMVGRELSAVFPKRSVPLGATVLELRGIRCAAIGPHPLDISLRAGEILGVAGLVGAGRTELARTIFGLTPAEEGEIHVRGERVSIRRPSDAIEHGIAYVPEDRRRHGVVLEMPISSNVTLASLDRFSTFGALDFRREREVSAEYARRLGVKTKSIFTAVSSLSGGNQQKVALSRWLVTRPSVLILDEPTQGIDVGAKSEIHALMSDLVGQGVAILMISSELPEILGMSDRIAVMRGGAIVAVLERAEADQESILALALGHGSAGASPPAPN